MNTENRPPGNGRIFYSVLERADGRADVFLDPRAHYDDWREVAEDVSL